MKRKTEDGTEIMMKIEIEFEFLTQASQKSWQSFGRTWLRKNLGGIHIQFTKKNHWNRNRNSIEIFSSEIDIEK